MLEPALALVLDWGSYSYSRSVSEPEREWGSRWESREIEFAVEGTEERDVDDMESGDPVRGYEDSLSSTCENISRPRVFFVNEKKKTYHSISFSKAPDSLQGQNVFIRRLSSIQSSGIIAINIFKLFVGNKQSVVMGIIIIVAFVVVLVMGLAISMPDGAGACTRSAPDTLSFAMKRRILETPRT